MIEAPDGSTANCDSERTRQLYANLDAVADNCTCDGCRNYRAAWKLEAFQPDLVAACAQIGIDPARAFETETLESADGVILYAAQLPFFGIVSNESMFSNLTIHPWLFTSHLYGTARFSDGLAAIDFSVRLPWVLSEENPYE